MTEVKKALWVATEAGHPEIVRLLMDSLGDVEAKLKQAIYGAALGCAVRNDRTAVTQILLERLAKFRDYPNFLITSLVSSFSHDNARVLRLLLDPALPVDQRDTDGRTVLHRIVSDHPSTASLTMVELLLAKGVDLEASDSMGCTPLHTAIKAFAVSNMRPPSMNMIRHLLRKGANVHAKTTAGNTALHTAAECEPYGDWYVSRPNEHSPGIAILLLEHGAEIDAKNAAGQTPLHLIPPRNIALFSSFLSRGASQDAQDTNGQNALHVAAKQQSPEKATILLSRGAAIHAKDSRGRTALHLAVETRHAEIRMIRLLLGYGADVNSQDNRMRTPLHYATDLLRGRTRREICQVLMSKGADRSLKDLDGFTAGDLFKTQSAARIGGSLDLAPLSGL
jgi:ankyrin repeat protein